MRSYFPLTDYDFYALVLTGLVALSCIDHVFFSGIYVVRHEAWNLPYGFAVVIAAYITGQLASMFSALIIEQWLTCRKLGPPRNFLLAGEMPARWKLLGLISASHYSSPLPATIQQAAIRNTAKELGVAPESLRERASASEEVFQFGYARGRCLEDSCRRLDRDRREYEFSRNLAWVSVVCAPLLLTGPEEPSRLGLAILAFIVALIMLIRFFRYFISYHAQVLQAAALPEIARGPRAGVSTG